MNDYACILIWDAHTRMGHNIGPYAYTGYPIRVWANIRIWGRTSAATQYTNAVISWRLNKVF